MLGVKSMPKVKWDVLGLGAVAVDELVYLDHHPQPDSKQRMLSRQRQGGGLTGTALAAAARLGAHAAFCGVLGEDELSGFALESLQREGIDTSPVIVQEGARPHYSIVLVDQSTGKRSVLSDKSGVVTLKPSTINPGLIRLCKVLFIDHSEIEAGMQGAKLARETGVPVVADLERDEHSRTQELLRYIDHLIVGVKLGAKLTGARHPATMVGALGGVERACTVVTAGDRGCWYSQGGGRAEHYPAFKVPVVDTTGCGDVFHGAYAAAIAFGETVPRAIHIATAAAGLKATRKGGRAGIPDLAAVEAFLEERGE